MKSALQKAASKSEWISWLLNDNGDAARSTLDFLKTCFTNIPNAKHPRILQKLGGDKNEAEATIHELVAHELLYRLGLNPEFEPSVDGLTPDLSFETEGKRFFADVYLTHSPLKTIKDFGDGTGEAFDTSILGESRAHKIASKLATKAETYKGLKLPLVIFIFLGDHRILSTRDVEKSLFGMTTYEASLEERFPESISPDRVPVGGLLLPDEDGNYRHRNLSAVISCDWFDTLNPEDRGKRLHCLVLHNWAGEALPINAFKFFPQIIWNRSEPDVWNPEQTLTATNIVAKFTLDGRIIYGEYTPNIAW